jgi:hypothetical protein
MAAGRPPRAAGRPPRAAGFLFAGRRLRNIALIVTFQAKKRVSEKFEKYQPYFHLQLFFGNILIVLQNDVMIFLSQGNTRLYVVRIKQICESI